MITTQNEADDTSLAVSFKAVATEKAIYRNTEKDLLIKWFSLLRKVAQLH